jgi:hypothetical protein
MRDEEFEQRIEHAMVYAVLPEVKDRAMRSSTFKAIAELEDVPPEEWDEDLLDEVIEDVIAIDRVRWMERALWIFAVLSVGAGAFLAGWHFKPVPEPEPVKWDCSVVIGSREQVKCTGMQ